MTNQPINLHNPVNSFKHYPKNISKKFPRRIFKDRGDEGGGADFATPPLYPKHCMIYRLPDTVLYESTNLLIQLFTDSFVTFL